MSFDLDKEEFYQTFTELQENEGTKRALDWAWSALEWTQLELRKVSLIDGVDGEAYNMGRSEGQADIAASLRHILDPEDKNHWNIIGLLKEVIRISGERAAVVAWLREQRQYGTDDLLGQGFANVCGILADTIEDGEHRREED
jgi:hypothetical protein